MSQKNSMSQYATYIKSILFALLFLIGVGTSSFLWSMHIESLGSTLQDAIRVVSDGARFEEEYSSLASLLSATQAEREQLQTFILKDEHDTIQLLSQIDALAADKKVELSTSRLDTTETKGTFNELSATFLISGTEVSVMQVVKALESLPYHSDMTALSVTRRVLEDSGTTEMTANVSLSISIQKHD